MAVTRFGVAGPMTAYGTFEAKEASAAGTGHMLPLMGVGSWVIWLLLGEAW